MIGLILRSIALACTASLAMLANPAAAQTWPTKSVTIIVPLAPGTGMDTLVRLYAEKLSQSLDKPVIVDNRPGAALMLGASALAKSAPDGYTLGVSTSSAMAINPTLYKQILYDPEKDFVPISLYVKSPFILVINPALAARNVPELIKLAKEGAAPLSYSTPGAGTAQHLSAEFMKQKFGVNITHVPYKSSPQSVSDIVAGHVSMAFAEAGLSLPLIRDGKLRALAVSSSTRLPTLPDVLPFAEAASSPDFEAVSWHVLLAPAGTPRDIVDRLHEEMKRILAAPEMQQRIANLGLLALPTPSVDGVNQYMRAEREKWGSLVKSLGLAGSQ
ncbi:MAG: tripartite tricarboxylate transporter substrate binding protein [Betaproteobacteria bacterium]|nr:tripartite tricarboxylate transporter substrate binding protein [Betaproteobacteria bacterium]